MPLTMAEGTPQLAMAVVTGSKPTIMSANSIASETTKPITLERESVEANTPIAAAKTVTDGRRGASKGVVGLVALAAIVVAADVILANLPLRADMTAEGFYTLSSGSKAVLGKLEEDVTLKFYVSSSAADMPMQLKTYAARVQNLLKEYERASGGRIVLEAYDPKPDSDAEEWAQRYGVEPQTVNPFGSPIYFGVVAVCGDHEQTLGSLSPRTESTLEYDITRLVTRVAWPERPVVGVMTSLGDVLGGQANPMMMQMGQRPPEAGPRSPS